MKFFDLDELAFLRMWIDHFAGDFRLDGGHILGSDWLSFSGVNVSLFWGEEGLKNMGKALNFNQSKPVILCLINIFSIT